MKLLLCLFAVLALSRAEKNPFHPLTEYMRKQAQDINGTISPDLSANINEIVDQVMDEIGDYFASVGLDPLDLPDIKEGFKVEAGLIEFHGELELTNGQVHDLSSVERAGDASLHYDKKLLRVKMGFLFEKLRMNYDYLARIMNIGPKGQVLADVRKTELHFDILLDLEDFTFHLQDFKITKIGQIKVNFKGNGILDWLINPLLGIVTGLFNGLIREVISATIENVIKEILNEINQMPKADPMIMFY